MKIGRNGKYTHMTNDPFLKVDSEVYVQLNCCLMTTLGKFSDEELVLSALKRKPCRVGDTTGLLSATCLKRKQKLIRHFAKLSRLSGQDSLDIFPDFTKVFNTISENLPVPKMAKHGHLIWFEAQPDCGTVPTER